MGKSKKLLTELTDALRCAMYGNANTFLDEVKTLTSLLEEYDDYKPAQKSNRLVRLAELLDCHAIEYMNDEKEGIISHHDND